MWKLLTCVTPRRLHVVSVQCSRNCKFMCNVYAEEKSSQYILLQ